MPQAARAGARSHMRRPHVTLNSDGKRHPLENAMAAFSFVAGIVAFATGLIVRDHLVATVAGLAGLGVGLYAQMISATREQRILIMAGVIAAFTGAGLGIAHGGFA